MTETTVMPTPETKKPARAERGVKLRGAEKVSRIPVKVIPTETLPKKPDWLRVRMPVSPQVTHIKQTLRKHGLHTVCEEASCPNLGECFSGGYPPLPLLRCRAWTTQCAQRERASRTGGSHCRDAAQLRRGDVRGSR